MAGVFLLSQSLPAVFRDKDSCLTWGLQDWKFCSESAILFCCHASAEDFLGRSLCMCCVTENTQMAWLWKLNYMFPSTGCAGWDNYILDNESDFTESVEFAAQWKYPKLSGWMWVWWELLCFSSGCCVSWSQQLIWEVFRNCLCEVSDVCEKL